MKERIINFNQIAKDSLANKFSLQQISLPDDLKKINILKFPGFVKVENSIYKNNHRIKKLAGSSITLNGIINTTVGILYSENSFDVPILVFEKTELPRIITFAFIDFIPLSSNIEYQKKYLEPLKSISADLDYIPGRNNPLNHNLGSPYPFSGFFKRHFKFSAGIAMERYLELWVDFLEKAAPVNSPEYSEEINLNRKKFRKEYSFSNRNNKFLETILGKDFSKKLLKEIFL